MSEMLGVSHQAAESESPDRTGLAWEDVCPLDGKHGPRIAVLHGGFDATGKGCCRVDLY